MSDAKSEPVKGFLHPVRLKYEITAGEGLSRFLRALEQKQLTGQRCPECKKVNIPPRGTCPTCGVPTPEDVPLEDTGTITTFCVINIPFEAKALELPYVCASIAIDGADGTLFHLILGVPAHEVRMGMRVRAVWADKGVPSLESITHFQPTGEPDAPFESYKGHL